MSVAGGAGSQARTINLALQGGGSHGAFTWGVLDRLLQEPGVAIEGISGTSAGAVNAVVLADGWEAGGAEGARDALRGLWRRIADRGSWWPLGGSGWSPFAPGASPFTYFADWLSHFVSPYQFNPSGYNALQQLLADAVNWERLRKCRWPRVFVSATNVRTNRLHIFAADDLSPEAVAASACLPQLYHAVRVGGEHYWDGGYMGNPTLEPLLTGCDSRDILVVQVNPRRRDTVPTTAEEISDRVNEITFNASLLREMRGIAQVTRMLDELGVTGHQLERAYFHLIDGDDVLAEYSARSKLDTGWPFLTRLFDKGHARASDWLAANRHRLGRGSTLDLAAWAPPYG